MYSERGLRDNNLFFIFSPARATSFTSGLCAPKLFKRLPQPRGEFSPVVAEIFEIISRTCAQTGNNTYKISLSIYKIYEKFSRWSFIYKEMHFVDENYMHKFTLSFIYVYLQTSSLSLSLFV